MRKSDLYRINLNLLVVLKSLLQTQSVNKTAAELHMSQSAVSRALAGLRETFGDPLFLKTSKGMIPTSKANALAFDVDQAIQSIESIFEPSKFDPTESTHIFRIATTDYGAMAVMPSLMQSLTKIKSTIRLETPPLSPDMMDKLATGKLDFALFVQSMRPKEAEFLQLFKETYSCLVRRGHPALDRVKEGGILIDDYVAWPHIITSINTGRRGIMDERLEKMGYERKVKVWTPYFQVAPLMVAQSDSILTLPTRVAELYSNVVGVVLLKPPIEITPLIYELIWHPRTSHDPAAIWFRDIVAKSMH